MSIKDKLSKRQDKFADFVYGVNKTDKLGLFAKLKHFFVERMKISYKEKSLFYQLFGVLIDGGVTTVRSLVILKSRTENERFFRVINTIVADVEQGMSLSMSMEKFPDVFSKMETGIIRTGEAVGALDTALARLAFQADRQSKVRQDLKSALAYPAMIAVVLVIAAVVMVTFVIPELKALYTENDLSLTGLTSALIGISDFVATYWLALVAMLGIAWLAFKIYVSSSDGKLKWDAFLLDLPYFGEVIRKYNIAEFASTLGILVESGLPIQEALRTTNKALQNSLYRLKTFELIGRVQTGDKISQVLAESSWLFPPNVTQMIEIGEQSATLGDLSMKIARQYDEELGYSLKNMNSVIGPVVIIIVAIFVVLFALAILLPIFNLTQNVAI